MALDLTEPIADWTSSCRYEDIPERVRERARLQVASVLGAIFAGSRTRAGAGVARATRAWGDGDDATILPEGTRAPLLSACFVNATRSVALDYDDYLFAGHTGHSAVVAPLALGEHAGARGADVLTAQVVANEVAGRLGAAFLLGAHNGQMWTYIHALAGACVGARFLALDARATRNAIGIALAQPPYPLSPGFFGPDSKATLAASPLVDGMRAAFLAAEGLTGPADVLGAADGMLARFGPRPFRFPFSALGDAWVTDSLTYKLYPGCAYVDTAVDAFTDIRRQFEEKTGHDLAPDDVRAIHVAATMFTCGMEAMAAPHRVAGELRATDVNFSVGLSLGVSLVCGRIDASTLSPDSLARDRAAIERVAERVTLAQDPALDAQTGGLTDAGIDLGAFMAAGAEPESLAGADFSKFEMRFPARVTLTTASGDEFGAEVVVPFGGAGRPWDETMSLVREKFGVNATHLADPGAALETVLSFDSTRNISEVVAAVAAHP
jgi:2-methylcitrate dehydratase PrpD